jgi:D-lactate dehydrogenase
MKPTRIAFYDAKGYDMTSFDEANRAHGFEIKYLPSHLTGDTARLAQGFDVVCAFVNDQVNAEVIAYLEQQGIGLLALRCAGYNNVDLRAAVGQLRVVRVPDYSPYAVAEHTIALMLALNRKTHKAYLRTREGNFSIQGLLGFTMHGKTAGVIGTGKIGLAVARILRGFGMRVIAFDRYPRNEMATELGYTYVDLGTLFREADIITLHCPLTQETVHLIDDSAIECMKDGVVIVNTGRGQLIDTRALIAGLKRKKVGAAGLDVYEEESEYFFQDLSDAVMDDDVLARLLTFGNVLVTSHQGFFTREALEQIARTTLESVREYVEGLPLTHEVSADPALPSRPR